jgi:hypothetical protein
MTGRPGWPRRDLPGPEQAKTGAMPGNDRFWFDDGQRPAPVSPNAEQPDPQQAIRWGQSWAFSSRPLKHGDLVAQSQVFQPQCGLRTEDRGQGGDECRERNEHRKKELGKKYNSHPLSHFEVFERHSRNVEL